MSELIPCPFCGWEFAEHAWNEFGEEYRVCDQCGASSGTVDSKWDWQSRPIEDELRKRIAELEAQLEERIDQFITHYNDAVSAGKVSVDVKRELTDAEIEELGAQEAERRWRIIADGEMPEDRATVLVAFKNREILTATYYEHYEGFGGVENYWHIEGWHSGNVTHWMPLPQPPEAQQ